LKLMRQLPVLEKVIEPPLNEHPVEVASSVMTTLPPGAVAVGVYVGLLIEPFAGTFEVIEIACELVPTLSVVVNRTEL